MHVSTQTIPREITDYDFFKRLKGLSFVQKIFLYGSRARREAERASDIDLAISAPGVSPGQWQQILDIIENADTLLEIDCIDYDGAIEQTLKANIDRDKVLLYEKSA